MKSLQRAQQRARATGRQGSMASPHGASEKYSLESWHHSGNKTVDKYFILLCCVSTCENKAQGTPTPPVLRASLLRRWISTGAGRVGERLWGFLSLHHCALPAHLGQLRKAK